MVFGDNVRARRAARALPRTPPTRQEEKKGEETEKTNDKTTHHTPHTAHHRSSAPTQPCHKDTYPTNNAVTANTRRKMRTKSSPPTHHRYFTQQHEEGEERDDTKGAGTTQRRGDTAKRTGTVQDKGTRTHQHTRPSTRPPRKLQGGHQHTDGDVSNTTALPSQCHPPSTMPPPTTTVRGEQTKDTPPHEQHRHTLTTHTPHTRQDTVHDTTAVPTSTALGWTGHGGHHRLRRAGNSTRHRHSTAAHTEKRRTPSTLSTLTLFTFTQPTNNQ